MAFYPGVITQAGSRAGSAISISGNDEVRISSAIGGGKMTSAEESMWDPFGIGVYALEALIILAIIYAMYVLPAVLKPMP